MIVLLTDIALQIWASFLISIKIRQRVVGPSNKVFCLPSLDFNVYFKVDAHKVYLMNIWTKRSEHNPRTKISLLHGKKKRNENEREIEKKNRGILLISLNFKHHVMVEEIEVNLKKVRE